MTIRKQLDEKIQTGGGATGVSQTADPVAKNATLPASNLSNGESMNTIDKITPGQAEQDTDTANNVKAVSATAGGNKSSVAMKPSAASASMKEDVDAMFSGEELSETFKEKATVIFEAAVAARTAEITADLEEQYNTALAEEVAAVEESLQEKLEQYLEYVAEQWMEENRVAVQASLKSEITESFIESLKGLFAEHYITVPEEKFDVIEGMQEQIEEIQAHLDTVMEENIALKGELSESTREKVLSTVAEGLTATQAEKLATLAEGVGFDSAANFQKKLEIVKESYFPTDKSSKPQNLLEELNEEVSQTNAAPTNSAVAQYASAISRTLKK